MKTPLFPSSRCFVLTLVALVLLTISQGSARAAFNWTTVAGNTGGAGYADGVGTAAQFSSPADAAVDAAGNVYVADTNTHVIRKITPGGTVSTFAGFPGSPGSADGVGNAARFNFPRAIAVNASGAVFVADSGNNTIRRILSNGVVTTIAGSAGIAGSLDGSGTAARFRNPTGIVVDASGNVFVADTDNHTIRKISSGGTVTTLAGSPGLAGSVNGTGSAARFKSPGGVAVDTLGYVYVADTGNHLIRKITPASLVVTLVGAAGIAGSANGTGGTARFSSPDDLTVDSAGNIFVGDTGNHTIRKITPASVASTLAGSPGTAGAANGTGTAARFKNPRGLSVDAAGNLFVADAGNNLIRRVSNTAAVTTLAGKLPVSGSVDGIGSGAQFNNPQGLAFASSGALYVVDTANHTIRRISGGGVTITLAGSAGNAGSADGVGNTARFNRPEGIAFGSDGSLYVADTGNHTIRKVTTSGVVTTVAGRAGHSGTTDTSTGISALFNSPKGIATSGTTLYVADSGSHTIRKITISGTSAVVSTFAGTAGKTGSVDGVGAAARFSDPTGITVGGGSLYVADTGNQTIRKLSTTGVVTTIAGSPGKVGSTDNAGASARFNNPRAVVANGGTVYVADTGNHTVRQIAASGAVTTVGGAAGAFGNVNGSGSAARFYSPKGLTIDNSGNLYLGDTSNNRIVRGLFQ